MNDDNEIIMSTDAYEFMFNEGYTSIEHIPYGIVNVLIVKYCKQQNEHLEYRINEYKLSIIKSRELLQIRLKKIKQLENKINKP